MDSTEPGQDLSGVCTFAGGQIIVGGSVYACTNFKFNTLDFTTTFSTGIQWGYSWPGISFTFSASHFSNTKMGWRQFMVDGIEGNSDAKLWPISDH